VTPEPASGESPVRVIYRWDLDKTYLQTDFDSLRSLMRTAMQKATEKQAMPGAAALIRELKSNDGARLCIVSGSPTQMRAVLVEKLRLDGVAFDELVLKDNLRNLVRGRFKALRGQVGYKLPVLLESRARAPASAEEVLFGDDAEADAFIYSLYADMVARRVDERIVRQVLEAAEVYADDTTRILRHWKGLAVADPVRHIFINLDRLTPPASFSRYGPRVVPVFNYFQAALVLLADKHLSAPQVVRVMIDMMGTAGHNLLTLSNSFQDLVRRGLQLGEVVEALLAALRGLNGPDGPAGVVNLVRPVPDILAAFTRRIAALGAVPPAPAPRVVDYLHLLDDARPRTHRGRRRF
jgi:hypothetical protein